VTLTIARRRIREACRGGPRRAQVVRFDPGGARSPPGSAGEEARLTTTTTRRPAVGAPVPARAGWRRRIATELGVVVAYLLASGLLYHRVLGDLAGRATGWVSSDSSLFTWWLGWTLYAPVHGLDPLTSTAQNAPDGVDGMWNTGVPVLGALLAPVTATAGPVVADNVAMILGPAVSAYAAYRALAVLVGPRWIRALAGLVYGFSPFVIAHAWVGHVNLVWSVLPPVVLWAAVRVLAGRGRVPGDGDGNSGQHAERGAARPWRDGALLGLAFAVQVGLYTQTVALGAVALVVVAVVLAVSAPRAAWRRLPALARPLAAAAVVLAVLCAWPAWVLLRGPSRPRGPIRDAVTMGADAANLVVPTPLTAIRPGTDALAAGMRAYPGEQGSYLGVAMLAVFLAAVVLVRSRAVVVTAVVTVVLGVASLGTSVAVLRRDTGVPLPWRVLVDLPLVGQAEAGRLAPFVALGVVAVWALALQHLTRPVDGAGTGPLRRVGRAVVVAVVLAAAVTWVPVDDQRTTAADAPAFFTAGAPGLGPAAPDGGPPIVEMVPRPSQAWLGGGDPLRWQALAGYSFRQSGGYFIGGSATTPVLYEGEVGAFQRGVADGGRGDVAAARADLAARQVGVIVVVPAAVRDPDAALRWARAVGGGPGRSADGVWIVPVCVAGRCGP
jgi:hypothetical protein